MVGIQAYITSEYTGRNIALFYIAGMVGEDFLAEACIVEMQINLSRGDALMSKHLLDSTQIGSPLKQMSGK